MRIEGARARDAIPVAVGIEGPEEGARILSGNRYAPMAGRGHRVGVQARNEKRYRPFVLCRGVTAPFAGKRTLLGGVPVLLSERGDARGGRCRWAQKELFGRGAFAEKQVDHGEGGDERKAVGEDLFVSVARGGGVLSAERFEGGTQVAVGTSGFDVGVAEPEVRRRRPIDFRNFTF